jgi:Winged helix DNA-binding domain
LANIAVHRLHSQQFAHTTLEKPGEAVKWMAAVQAQDYSGAKWSIGLRLPDSTDAAIEQTIADNTFFRTWGMRGTLQKPGLWSTTKL